MTIYYTDARGEAVIYFSKEATSLTLTFEKSGYKKEKETVTDPSTVKTLNITLSRVEGCFIATAVYGTDMHEDINILRRYRDDVLLKRKITKPLVNIYYKTSPPIAKVVANNKHIRSITRKGIKGLVKIVRRYYNER